MQYSNSIMLEFSDPCSSRVSSVAQNRLILIRMTRAVVMAYRGSSCCAPARGNCDTESAATSEKGMKNARIEANGGDTQKTETTEDGAQKSDSDGEKRSQFNGRSDVATKPKSRERRHAMSRHSAMGLLSGLVGSRPVAPSGTIRSPNDFEVPLESANR
jgi:hypothetical protein